MSVVFHLCMMILFLLAAGVNFNDDDYYLWVPLYGMTAYTSWNQLRPRKTVGYLPRTLILICVAILGYQNMMNQEPIDKPFLYSETGRELLGLLLVMFYTVIIFVGVIPPMISSMIPPMILSMIPPMIDFFAFGLLAFATIILFNPSMLVQ